MNVQNSRITTHISIRKKYYVDNLVISIKDWFLCLNAIKIVIAVKNSNDYDLTFNIGSEGEKWN